MPTPQPPTPTSLRPRVAGKFLWHGDVKAFLRGVTYGPFAPGPDGEYGAPHRVEADFGVMASHGVNSVRCYTVPPRWLLDIAHRHDLTVLVGLPWEQHIAFLQDRSTPRQIVARVTQAARSVAGHPALLGFAVGNEIPAPIVRWHGRRRIERFIARLYHAVKEVDPQALVTYVNYPTTEYLDLPFLDLISFNVYLERPETLHAYLGRLQNLAGDRPLLLAEVGLDSRSHGEQGQAQAIEWQLRTAYAFGCAGAMVFAWTDEWHRGGQDIHDWDFGLVSRDRTRKPALSAVERVFLEAPFPHKLEWPSVSVVVCSYNGASTIRDTLEHLGRLDYPRCEVIVIDDGSTDTTAQIASEYPVRLISTPNQGLSAARNLGLQTATGDIVAYIDDDAYPDPDWLKYLARTLMTSDHVGVGGPNLPPPGDGLIAECVGRAPGGPAHVLLSDTLAEHIPGCNMAFVRDRLLAIGGFDPRFRTAGDDVDVCWRLQEAGGTIGFSPAAMVWHHRRNSVRMYFKQQVGYGRAEAMLEQKWPRRFNAAGHISWNGRIYGGGSTASLLRGRPRVYQGTWGLAPFQRLYQPASNTIAGISAMPEWLLVIGGLACIGLIGGGFRPALVALPVAAALLLLSFIQAWRSAANPGDRRPLRVRLQQRSLTAALHLVQPIARLTGRLVHGLTPWRRRGVGRHVLGGSQVLNLWSEAWRDPVARLAAVESALAATGAVVRHGGDFDSWDLEIRGGLFGGARAHQVVEEHGDGKQLVRWRLSRRPALAATVTAVALLLSGLAAATSGAAIATGLFLGVGLVLLVRSASDCGVALGALERAILEERRDEVVLDSDPARAKSQRCAS